MSKKVKSVNFSFYLFSPFLDTFTALGAQVALEILEKQHHFSMRKYPACPVDIFVYS